MIFVNHFNNNYYYSNTMKLGNDYLAPWKRIDNLSHTRENGYDSEFYIRYTVSMYHHRIDIIFGSSLLEYAKIFQSIDHKSVYGININNDYEIQQYIDEILIKIDKLRAFS